VGTIPSKQILLELNHRFGKFLHVRGRSGSGECASVGIRLVSGVKTAGLARASATAVSKTKTLVLDFRGLSQGYFHQSCDISRSSRLK